MTATVGIPGQRAGDVATPTGRLVFSGQEHSEGWYAARSKRLGGSEIAAIVGLSPYQSRYSLWHEKNGTGPARVETPAMTWGKYVEPSLLAWYNDKYRPIQTKPGSFTHRDHDWMLANPDALADDRVVEAKADHNPSAWGRPGTDQVPPQYRCQKSWYMITLGYRRCDLIASLSGSAPEVWTLEYDQDDADWLIREARDFLDSLERGEAPDIDGHDATYRAVRAQHPDIDPKSKFYLTDELTEAYEKACRDEKASATAKTEACGRIIDAMGDAQYAMNGKRKVARRQSQKGGIPFLVPAGGK